MSERQRRATGLHSPTVGQQVPATQEQPPQAEQQAGSREEELLETREQKLTTVKPAKPSRLGAILARFESRGFQQATTAQFGHFYVGVGQVSEVSGLAPGALYERRRVIATPWTFQAIGGVSFLGYQVYGLRFGHFRQPAPYDFLGDGFLGAPFEFDERAVLPPQRYLYIDTHYSSFPDEAFYGIGPDSEFDDRVHFRQEAFSLDGVGGYQITRWFAVQARAGWIDTNVGPPVDTNLVDAATRFNDQDVPGIDFQADYWRLDASFYLSYLGDPNNPSGSLGLRLGRYNDADGDRFDFLRVSLDARGYLPLGSRQRVLAARFYTSSDFPDSDAEVPFYLMGTLGGPYKLRGFADQRFRDRNLIFITGEYRWEASPGLEFAVFYGAGKVFHEYSERNFDHLQHNWGGGVRFKNMRRVVLRLDLGSSDEGTYFQFNFGPSF
ncbi:MAG: hypothetical protein PVJ51_03140 [Acidobacteriota bacterium]